MKTLGVLIPVYNEEDKIDLILEPYKDIKTKNETLNIQTKIIFIDDGSKDSSYVTIKKFFKKFKIQGGLIKLRKNFGKDRAILAALKNTNCDYYVVVDADLQTPLFLIPEMLKKLLTEQLDIVKTVKEIEPYGSLRKMFTAIFFKLAEILKIDELKKGRSDFIIFTKKVKGEILNLNEKEFLLRAMIAWHHFKEGEIFFHPTGLSQKTKYSLKKLMIIGIKSIVTFSNFLRINFIISMIYWIIAAIYGCFIIYNKITNKIVTGLSSTLLLVLVSFAILFLMLAIFGEILKILFEEVKQRPKFLVEKVINYKDGSPIKHEPKSNNT